MSFPLVESIREQVSGQPGSASGLGSRMSAQRQDFGAAQGVNHDGLHAGKVSGGYSLDDEALSSPTRRTSSRYRGSVRIGSSRG
jgi:hypothetical protein